MPENNPRPIDSNMPLWQFMFAHSERADEQKFRQHYLDADVKQVTSITLTIAVLMGVMTLADIPRFADVSGLSFGAVLRMMMLMASVLLLFSIKKWHSPRTIDLGIASFALLVAFGIVSFHMAADVPAARIGTVGTLFIFVANITYPAYSLYILPAVLVFLLGDTVVLLDPSREGIAESRTLIIIVFIFAELMSVFVSAHLQRTRYMAFRAFSEVRTLSGMIPICSSCNKIRDDSGYYQKLEKYISEHSDAQFSHGVCPECREKLYPELKDSIHPPKAKGRVKIE